MLNHNIKFGIYAGIGVQAYFLLFYFISKPWMLHPSVYWSSLAITVIFMARAAMTTKQLDGVLDWKEGLKSTFTVFLVSSLLFGIFFYALFQADPSLLEAQKEMQLNQLDQAGKFFSLPETDIEEAKKTVEDTAPITIKELIFSYTRSAIGGFILSVIVTFITRSVSKF